MHASPRRRSTRTRLQRESTALPAADGRRAKPRTDLDVNVIRLSRGRQADEFARPQVKHKGSLLDGNDQRGGDVDLQRRDAAERNRADMQVAFDDHGMVADDDSAPQEAPHHQQEGRQYENRARRFTPGRCASRVRSVLDEIVNLDGRCRQNKGKREPLHQWAWPRGFENLRLPVVGDRHSCHSDECGPAGKVDVQSGSKADQMKRGQSLDWPLRATGAPGRIRTHDPLVRSQVLYPTELRARSRQL